MNHTDPCIVFDRRAALGTFGKSLNDVPPCTGYRRDPRAVLNRSAGESP